MSTLRSLATVASGLYRDAQSGQAYQAGDLLDRLPDDVLCRPIRLERRSLGVYLILVGNGEDAVFELWSRRRSARTPHENRASG